MDYSGLPEGLQDGMERYVKHGIMPGDFLTAVLSNDLRGSFMRADNSNRSSMFEIVSWCWNELPWGAWGTHGTVLEWVIEQREGDK